MRAVAWVGLKWLPPEPARIARRGWPSQGLSQRNPRTARHAGKFGRTADQVYFFISSFFMLFFFMPSLCMPSFDMPWVPLFAMPSLVMVDSVPILVESWPAGPVDWAEAVPMDSAPMAVA